MSGLTKRLCGECRQAGHYASRCPQKDAALAAEMAERQRTAEAKIAHATASRATARAILYAPIDETERQYRDALGRLHAAQDDMLSHRRRLESLLDALKTEALKP